MYERSQVRKSNKVYASNLSYLATEEELTKLFGEFGRVVDVNLKRKEAITFAFIEFSAVEEAEAAIEALNRKSINGLDMKCEFARGERKTFNTRGGYSGDRGERGGYRGSRGDGAPRRDFGDRPRGCFNCGEEGHMIRDCPKPRKPRDDDGQRGGGDYGRERQRPRRSSSARSRSGEKRKQRRRRSSSGSR